MEQLIIAAIMLHLIKSNTLPIQQSHGECYNLRQRSGGNLQMHKDCDAFFSTAPFIRHELAADMERYTVQLLIFGRDAPRAKLNRNCLI